MSQIQQGAYDLSTDPGLFYLEGNTSIGDGSRNVTTAGTRVQLSASSVPCRRVIIQPKATNTNYIYVGGGTVSATSGIALQPEQSIILTISNLNLVYIDSAVNDEGVKYLYEN